MTETKDIYSKYEVIIGLEVHVQLLTASKLFAPDSAAFGGKPNDHTSFITLAHPGTLPYINKKAVEFAIKMGFALNCPINQINHFDRKNYFYPDLPKGYQISQDNRPICGAGYLPITVNGEKRKIGIHHIHMEEDAGKSIHDQDPHYSMIDLNRAGVPLLEIVTQPDMRSGEETTAFLNEMRKTIQFLGVSDGNMEEGSLRCDANISVRLKGSTELNNRAEIKNMNSVKFIRKAIDYEFQRQVEMMERGETVVQQTRGFDSEKGITLPQREKEMAHDYRYFPEPDLPALHVSDDDINAIRAAMPPMPYQLIEKYVNDYQIPEGDAVILTETLEFAQYFEALAAETKDNKQATNWMLNMVKSYLNTEQLGIQDFGIAPNRLAGLIGLVKEGKVSLQVAKQELFPALLQEPNKSAAEIAKEKNVLIEADGNFAEELIAQILEQSPNEVKAYKNGKKQLIGMFMGKIMKASKGKINAKDAKKILEEKLKNK